MLHTDGHDKGVNKLRTMHDDDCLKVAEDIFAHYYIQGRNELAIQLIVRNHIKCTIKQYQIIYRKLWLHKSLTILVLT